MARPIDADVLLADMHNAMCADCEEVNMITEYDESIRRRDDEYGITWRAWTGMPTNEQRKAKEWDG